MACQWPANGLPMVKSKIWERGQSCQLKKRDTGRASLDAKEYRQVTGAQFDFATRFSEIKKTSSE